MSLGKRMRLTRLGKTPPLSQSDLARAVGCTPQAIQAIEAGATKRQRLLNEIAAALGTTPEWLVTGKGEPVAGKQFSVATALVRGMVAAGVWQEDTSQVTDITNVPASPEPRYSRFEQIAFRVVGNSMNRVVRDGEYAICIDMDENPMALRSGDVVVVERHRAGEYERTIKEYRDGTNGPELWPQSTDPTHQQPIQVGAPEDGTAVRIVGFVVGYYRPA